MKYPKYPDFTELGNLIRDYASYKTEVGSEGVQDILNHVEKVMNEAVIKLNELPVDAALKSLEPDSLEQIRALRPGGKRTLKRPDDFDYKDKLSGALIARLAGCTLGAPVEFWSLEDMESWAKYNDQVHPPVDYWQRIKNPYELRYTKGDFIEYTKPGMSQVPVDDDIAYTLLALLILEEYGLDFSTKDVAEAWERYLPMAYTAEKVTLENLQKGVPVETAGQVDNPYSQWIGADIRSDGFAYVCPGQPEKAAELAYKDAVLSHRRNGIYGEMFFAAAQSAAFYVDDPLEAIRIGLAEIPEECLLAKDVKWALEVCHNVEDYRDARARVNERFDGMSHAHTNNNACLTVFGLAIGGTDVGKVIGEIVAMGMDNDCTAATAGSIAGAIAGFSKIEKHWYEPFNNTIDSYLIGTSPFAIDDVVTRFMKLAGSHK